MEGEVIRRIGNSFEEAIDYNFATSRWSGMFDTYYSPGELSLIKSISDGLHCSLGDERPSGSEASDYNLRLIRAEFLRSMITGSCPDVEVGPAGLSLNGAWISGDLDLRGLSIPFPIQLTNCHFTGTVNLARASIQDFILKGSKVYLLDLDSVYCSGNIILSYGFRTNLPVVARAARITGQLGCSGGAFCHPELAITLEAATIEQSFFWRRIRDLAGIVDLTHASVGILIDDAESWPENGKLRLDGFEYSQLGSNTSPNYFLRLEWLKRQYLPHLTFDFRPQPFEQLKKVLDTAGREDEAKKIAIKKLDYQRAANWLRCDPALVDMLQASIHPPSNIILRTALSLAIATRKKRRKLYLFSHPYSRLKWLGTFLFGTMTGYGYRPFRCVFISLAAIFVGATVFSYAYAIGNIVPRDTSVLATHWAEALSKNSGDPYKHFLLSAPDYPAFDPVAFAVDSFVPLVDLGQESKWSLNMSKTGTVDTTFRWFGWFYIMSGWILTALFGASITGIVRR